MVMDFCWLHPIYSQSALRRWRLRLSDHTKTWDCIWTITWSLNTDLLYRKGQSRMYFLWRLATDLQMTYQTEVTSVLFNTVEVAAWQQGTPSSTGLCGGSGGAKSKTQAEDYNGHQSPSPSCLYRREEHVQWRLLSLSCSTYRWVLF